MTKEIKLTQGQVAVVDDWWFDELNQYKWSALWMSNSFYAVRNSSRKIGRRTIILMHAVIAKTPKGMHTDHKNHNTLDNREENLRVCTRNENMRNRSKHKNNTSGYKGVSVSSGGRWRADIRINGKSHFISTHATPEDAARAYDDGAKKFHGEFAVLNFTEDK